MTYTYQYSIPIIHIIFQPHLHTIVNRSMELAMSAKEPYNYFLLLRALFRSIGGSSNDLYISVFYTYNSHNISAPPSYYSELFHGTGYECQRTIQLLLLLRALFRSIGGSSNDLYISVFYTYNSHNISAPPSYYSEPFHGTGYECQRTIQLLPATTSSV